MKSWAVKTIIALAGLVLICGIVLHFYNRRLPQVTDTTPAISKKSDSTSSRNFATRSQAVPEPEELEAQADRESANPLQVPREKIEEYLKMHDRDAPSLLAAFHAA